MSKGSIQRPTDSKAYSSNYDLIYGSKPVDNRPRPEAKNTAVSYLCKFAKDKSKA